MEIIQILSINSFTVRNNVTNNFPSFISIANIYLANFIPFGIRCELIAAPDCRLLRRLSGLRLMYYFLRSGGRPQRQSSTLLIGFVRFHKLMIALGSRLLSTFYPALLLFHIKSKCFTHSLSFSFHAFYRWVSNNFFQKFVLYHSKSRKLQNRLLPTIL